MSGFASPLRILAIVGGHEAPPPIVTAIAQLGRCSATLISPTVVLTSAHCLDAPIDHVTVGKREVAVTSCERHPGYLVGQVAHDLGFCRLGVSLKGALPIDTTFDPSPGQAVSLAGFGASAPAARESPELRVVATSIVGSGGDHLDVGTAAATACRGDSGGPVLVDRDGAFRVAGIIEGTRGVICRGPARAVPLGAQMEWLSAALAVDRSRSTEYSVLSLALAFLAGTFVVILRRRRYTAR